jgi:hypothetical protein
MLSSWRRRLGRIFPFLSLGTGLVGAFLMERNPATAWFVLAAALGAWILLWAFALASRLETVHNRGKRGLVARGARFSAFMGVQSLIQLNLFFALPFYAQSASFSAGHLLFGFILTGAAIISLWDPLCDAALRSAPVAVGLISFSSFCGFNVVLPILGLSNQVSLGIAGALSAAAFPALGGIRGQSLKNRKTLAIGVGAALLIPGLLLVGVAARWVPPAPLKLIKAEMGRGIANKEVKTPLEEVTGNPGELVCATTIWAPRGLSDQLFHVWRLEGEVLDRIPLTLRGGREEGFRTWSKKRNFGSAPVGDLECRVETAAGQLVGKTGLEFKAPEPEEAG